MSASEQLEQLASSWRLKHGPEVMRHRASFVLERVSIAFSDGRIAELSRKAGEELWTIDRDPDQAPPPVDLSALHPAVRKALER